MIIIKTLNFATISMLVIRASISMKPLLLKSPIIEGLLLAFLILATNAYYLFSKKDVK